MRRHAQEELLQALQRFLPPNRSMTHNQLNAALLNYLTYELEEKIKLIVAILTLSCFDGNSVGWMGPSLPLNNNCI